MTDIREQLQNSLGAAYAIDRELGGGGMSRTFLATERALARRVVIKVLAPELLAGISVERFKREVLLAAQLQHPHVVPVLSSGEAESHYMRFVELWNDADPELQPKVREVRNRLARLRRRQG